MTPESHENLFEIAAELKCGTRIKVVQPSRGANFAITATPKPGIDVSDFANIKDGQLHIRVTAESLVGLFQLLYMIIFPAKKQRKKLFGLF